MNEHLLESVTRTIDKLRIVLAGQEYNINHLPEGEERGIQTVTYIAYTAITDVLESLLTELEGRDGISDNPSENIVQ